MKPLISYLSVGALLLSPAVLLNPAMAQQTVSAGTVVQEFNQGQLDAMLAPSGHSVVSCVNCLYLSARSD